MAGNIYDEEFKRRAVDLYESTPDATIQGIATDLGVPRETLRLWVRALGSGIKTARGPGAELVAEPESDAARTARLEAELAAERAEVRKLPTERDILRSAAKHLAGETRW
ncbi:hypothetical protein DLJ96_02210 [Actinotalea fermentans ATCC 43279 = JCM 9966 = DSM 3133]|nr:hypothetical protein DLJ96_02210 [Actinotalea fermentans ATCC 43279 = JCM 9966 = DSM 3133]